MIDLVNDLNVLNHVSEKVLTNLVSLSTYCIGHAVHEEQCCKNDVTIVDIGIGELHIKCSSDGIRYRFIPSEELEKTLIKTITTGTSPILSKLDLNIKEKIEHAYKELL